MPSSTSSSWPAVLTGTVRDPAGEPRSGLQVVATAVDDPRCGASASIYGGSFRLVLAPGRHHVVVGSPGFEHPLVEQEVQIEVGQESHLVFVVER